MEKRSGISKQPSLVELAKQRDKFNCNHLVGKEVIERCIAELAMGRASSDYCQCWERCSCGWPKCGCIGEKWSEVLKKPEFRGIFTEDELKVISTLKA
jgi:hypothetical protein